MSCDLPEYKYEVYIDKYSVEHLRALTSWHLVMVLIHTKHYVFNLPLAKPAPKGTLVFVTSVLACWRLGPRGYSQYTWWVWGEGRSDGAWYRKPKKNTRAWNFTPKKIPGNKMPYRKIGAHHVTDLLTQKKYWGCKFSIQKQCQTPRHVYCKYPPLQGLGSNYTRDCRDCKRTQWNVNYNHVYWPTAELWKLVWKPKLAAFKCQPSNLQPCFRILTKEKQWRLILKLSGLCSKNFQKPLFASEIATCEWINFPLWIMLLASSQLHPQSTNWP